MGLLAVACVHALVLICEVESVFSVFCSFAFALLSFLSDSCPSLVSLPEIGPRLPDLLQQSRRERGRSPKVEAGWLLVLFAVDR